MKVLIVNNMAPFVWGGAEELAAHLERHLRAVGHEAESLRIPFQWQPASVIPSQMLMVQGLELTNVDRVIALKFPAYLIRHAHKTLWLLHQYRQAYDLLDSGQSNLPAGPAGVELRQLIQSADDECLAGAHRVFTNSDVTRRRLKKYNGFEARVLMPPVNDPELFTGGESGGYIFAGGRINSMKRQHLLIEALALCDKSVKLVIGGPPDTARDAERLHETAKRLDVARRLKFDMRFLSRTDYASYVNRSMAVAYLPYDEDSLGYVAMEAATARKPILTTSDSGGLLALVQDQNTGWVTDPTPDSLAEAMNAVFSDAGRAVARGRAAKDRLQQFGISWPKTIEALLQ